MHAMSLRLSGREVWNAASHATGLFPPPPNPSLLGFGTIVRKSGKPDLQWGGLGRG